ncbi:hypothetical protein [Alsobacter soli]|nr:hypothetical protein [Alsobacter soli]
MKGAVGGHRLGVGQREQKQAQHRNEAGQLTGGGKPGAHVFRLAQEAALCIALDQT